MLEFLIIGAVILVASWLQGSTGFGLGMLAAPALALVRPELLPATVIILALITSLFVFLREWRAVDWRLFGWIFVGRLPGTLVGAVAVALFAPAFTSLLVGVAVVGGVTLSFLGWHPAPHRRNLVLAGGASGVFGTATSIGGPPIAIVIRRKRPGQVRATMCAIFTVGSAVSLMALWASSSFTSSHLLAAAGLAPFMLVGLIASSYFGTKLDGRTLFITGAVAALIGGMLVIVNASVTLWS